MSDLLQTIQAVEGRMLAHRRLLARLLATLPEAERSAMLRWMDGRDVMSDGQEDPGAVPAEGLAQGIGIADEFRLIAQLAADFRSDPDPDAATI